MASAPQPVAMPLFYKDLMPLNSSEHGNWKMRATDKAPWLIDQHAIPLTVEEFPMAQRNFPIIFSAGPDPVPLALLGMNEGVNVFVDAEGTVTSPIYIPAYARRYPFMLARLRPDSEDLSLCFDPSSDLLGEFDDGTALFEGEEPSEATKGSLTFCEQFEIAAKKTSNFVEELKKHDLLIDGELTIQPDGAEQPFIYRGFRMISEEAVNDLRGDVARKLVKSGAMALIYAHLFSLGLTRELFGRQMEMGLVPSPQPAGLV